MEEIARLTGPRDLVFNEHRIEMTPVITATVAVLRKLRISDRLMDFRMSHRKSLLSTVSSESGA